MYRFLLVNLLLPRIQILLFKRLLRDRIFDIRLAFNLL